MQDVNSPFTIGNSGRLSSASRRTERWPTCRVVSPRRGTTSPCGSIGTASTRRSACRRAVSPVVLGYPRTDAASRFLSLEGIGIFDVARQSFQLLTSSAWGPPAIRSAPEFRFVAWHPDGERVTFTGVDGDLYWMRADGSGEAERLTTVTPTRGPRAAFRFPPRGRLMGAHWYSRSDSDRRHPSIGTSGRSHSATPLLPHGRSWSVPLTSRPRKSRQMAATSRIESNQSGRSEVYVQPFPGPGRRELVSIDGGAQPAWARNGRELFYRGAGSGADDADDGGGRDAGRRVHRGQTARAVGGDGARYPGGTGGRTYDVAPDGRRFLMTQQRDSAPQPPITHVVLVQNWLEELKRLVPRN